MSIIYIPIWFYFNVERLLCYVAKSRFTFQYGSTLIITIMEQLFINKIFTFQYGSTLILSANVRVKTIYEFTFQYGSTLMINLV